MVRRSLLLLALLALLPWSIQAQDATGRVVGRVTDPSGAVIPNAAITATNAATNISRTATTDATGEYQVLQLPIGVYRVKVEASGFAAAETGSKELRIDQSLRVDVQMSLGSANESVRVDAAGAPVETVESSLGGSVEAETIAAMPLNGRNVMSLVGLQAGATDQRSASRFRNGASFSISGGRPDSITYLLDGMNNNDLLNNGLVLNPNPDMIQEFRVIVSNGSAEYGRNAGGIVSAVMKSGTERFHGSVYDYYRNENFTANRFFMNKAGMDRPVLKRNQFGGTINGPLALPGLVNTPGKLFFSLGYQGQRQRNQVTLPAVTVFTPAELRGDFSRSYNGGPDPGVADFLQQFPYFQPNALLAAQAIIDPARINSVAKRYIAAGLIPSSESGAISPVGSKKTDNDEITGKIDYHPTSSDTIALTLGAQRNPTTSPFDASYSSNTTGIPFYTRRNAYLLNGAYTKIFSPRLINEVRLGAQRNSGVQMQPLNDLPTPSELGMSITPDLPTGPPLLKFISGLNVGAPILGPSRPVSNTFSAADTLTWARGKHTIKAGFSIAAFQNNMQYNYYGNGYFMFAGPFGGGSGNEFADFLLGTPDAFTQAPYAQSNVRTKAYSAFVQDEWRLRSDFTLTVGLRYEYNSPKTDTQGRTYSIVPGRQSTVFPNAPRGLLFPGDAGAPRGVNFPDRNDFAPRVGFAWRPWGERTSVRGGFGIYYDTLKAEDNLQFNGTAPFYSWASFRLRPVTGNPSSDATGLADPYRNAGVANPFPSRNPSRDYDFSPLLPFGTDTYFVDPHLRTPYVYQYNLSVQRELASNLVAEAAYVGNSSKKLTGLIDANPYVPGAGRRALNVTEEIFDYLNTFSNVGRGNYNSLQATLAKRPGETGFFGDAGFKLSYTLGHAIDTTSGYIERIEGQVPSYNPELFRASSDEDIRHRLAFSAQWELPFNRVFNRGPKRLIEGWILYPIVTWRSGFPIDVMAGMRQLGLPGPSGAGDAPVVRANLVGPIVVHDPKSTRTVAGNTGNYWFDPTSFSYDVTSGYGTLGRNAFRGPGRTNVDVAIAKELPVRETLKCQIRVEAFNLFNTVQWADPDENIFSDSFGQVSDTYDPRVLQFAIRISF